MTIKILDLPSNTTRGEYQIQMPEVQGGGNIFTQKAMMPILPILCKTRMDPFYNK